MIVFISPYLEDHPVTLETTALTVCIVITQKERTEAHTGI